VCVYIYIYIYIYRERERERENCQLNMLVGNDGARGSFLVV
jgi:hypothetical protein